MKNSEVFFYAVYWSWVSEPNRQLVTDPMTDGTSLPGTQRQPHPPGNSSRCGSFISINLTPKTRHSCLKKLYFPMFSRQLHSGNFQGFREYIKLHAVEVFFRVWGPTLMARNVLHQPKSIFIPSHQWCRISGICPQLFFGCWRFAMPVYIRGLKAR